MGQIRRTDGPGSRSGPGGPQDRLQKPVPHLAKRRRGNFALPGLQCVEDARCHVARLQARHGECLTQRRFGLHRQCARDLDVAALELRSKRSRQRERCGLGCRIGACRGDGSRNPHNGCPTAFGRRRYRPDCLAMSRQPTIGGGNFATEAKTLRPPHRQMTPAGALGKAVRDPQPATRPILGEIACHKRH